MVDEQTMTALERRILTQLRSLKIIVSFELRPGLTGAPGWHVVTHEGVMFFYREKIVPALVRWVAQTERLAERQAYPGYVVDAEIHRSLLCLMEALAELVGDWRRFGP